MDISMTMRFVVYVCVITCIEKQATNGQTTQGTADDNYGPRNVSVSESKVNVLLGTNSKLVTCSADCAPSCTYQWDRDTVRVTNGANLRRLNAQKSDSGEYTCTASNSMGTDTASFILNVVYAPLTIKLSHSTVSVKQGETTSVTCDADCNPACEFKWQKGTTRVSTSATLRIQKAESSDTGVYTCTASNRHGERAASVNVTVLEPPMITSFTASPPSSIVHGDSITFTCLVHSVPTPQITMRNSSSGSVLNSGTADEIIHTIPNIPCFRAANFTCEGNNSHYTEIQERSVEIQVLCAPDTPPNIQISRRSAVSLTVTWDVGWDGGRDQKYFIFISPSEENSFKEVNRHGGVYKLSNLTASRGYTISMYAENTIGTSSTSRVTGVTKALPSSDGLFKITLLEKVVNILLAFGHAESVTRFQIYCCISGREDTQSCTDKNGQTSGLSHVLQDISYPADGKGIYDIRAKLFDEQDIVQELTHLSVKRDTANKEGLITALVFLFLVCCVCTVLGVFLFRAKRGQARGKQKGGKFDSIDPDYEINTIAAKTSNNETPYENATPTRRVTKPNYYNIDRDTDQTGEEYADVTQPDQSHQIRYTENAAVSPRSPTTEYENVKFKGNMNNITNLKLKPKQNKEPAKHIQGIKPANPAPSPKPKIRTKPKLNGNPEQEKSNEYEKLQRNDTDQGYKLEAYADVKMEMNGIKVI